MADDRQLVGPGGLDYLAAIDAGMNVPSLALDMIQREQILATRGIEQVNNDFALAKQWQDEEDRRGESVSSSTTTAASGTYSQQNMNFFGGTIRERANGTVPTRDGTNDSADYMAPYQHKAVLFATYQDGEKGKWELNPECRTLLGNINKELCVVGIAGTHNLLVSLSHTFLLTATIF